ncbi:hypothetical protein TNCV_910101 [Trichonephila clavipes]|uniref:Uncharacterized protein n=1 Tax=Trichonephila clavipes TaxID=2585209 RepID=A0A8X7BED2_TRICX|nr:hypothetical protein TNCV_910101 [Trichonephila clavipes]
MEKIEQYRLKNKDFNEYILRKNCKLNKKKKSLHIAAEQKERRPTGVVSDADCSAVGTGFESRRRHGGSILSKSKSGCPNRSRDVARIESMCFSRLTVNTLKSCNKEI